MHAGCKLHLQQSSCSVGVLAHLHRPSARPLCYVLAPARTGVLERGLCYKQLLADLVCVALDWYAEGPAQPQVSDLECHGLVVNQKVLWLQVPVHHAVLVAVRQALDQLVQHALQAHVQQRNRRDRYSATNNFWWPGTSCSFARQPASTRLFERRCPHLPALLAASCTLMTGLGSGKLGPLPVRSMYFLRSVVRYSNTCNDAHGQ